MAPVATVQVGWVTFTVGAAGVGGWEFTVILVTEEIQLLTSFAVSV